MAHLLHAFNASLKRKPMITQCAASAVLFGAGDVIAQQAIDRKGLDHDFIRTARATFYGGAIFGPLLTKWIQFLNRLQFSSPTRGVIYRVWLDQAAFSPIAVGIFFGSMSLMEGKSFGQAQERISSAYVPTLMRNWCVFVPAQIINFALVPTHLRFLFVGGVSLFWNTYLSAVNSSKQAEIEHKVEELDV